MLVQVNNVDCDGTVDPESPISSLSFGWVSRLTPPFTITAGLDPRVVLSCDLSLQVSQTQHYDIVLGQDWLALYRSHFLSTSNTGSTSGGLRTLPDGIASSSTAPILNMSYINELVTSYNNPFEITIESVLLDHGLTRSIVPFSHPRAHFVLFHHLLFGACSLRVGKRCEDVAGVLPMTSLVAYIVNVLCDSPRNGHFLSGLKSMCAAVGFRVMPSHTLEHLLSGLQEHSAYVSRFVDVPLEDLYRPSNRFSLRDLLMISARHGLSDAIDHTNVRHVLYLHFISGLCVSDEGLSRPFPGCRFFSGCAEDQASLRQSNIRKILSHLGREQLSTLLAQLNVEVVSSLSVKDMRKSVLKQLNRERQSTVRRSRILYSQPSHSIRSSALNRLEEDLGRRANSWPKQLLPGAEDTIRRMFKKSTSTEALKEVVCASCACSVLATLSAVVDSDKIEPLLLRRPVYAPVSNDNRWIHSTCDPPPQIHNIPELQDYFVDPNGIVEDTNGHYRFNLCPSCVSSLDHHKVPPHALSNRTYLGPVPAELSDITILEESLIARCRAKSMIIQLNEDRRDCSKGQRGFRGHVIVYPQRPEAITTILPPSIEEISRPICILFVGRTAPSLAWLKSHARPLCVRGSKVRRALFWLKAHNPLYADVEISEENLNCLPADGVPAIPVEFIQDSEAYAAANEGLNSAQTYRPFKNSLRDGHANEFPLESLLVSDAEGHATPLQLRKAALEHMLHNKDFLQMPHGPVPETEFHNPDLLPKTYPTLFPYGIGGLEDPMRLTELSFKRHAKHLFSLNDRRFQEHYSFLFTVFNILQRRAILKQTWFKVKQRSFSRFVDDFETLESTAIHRVLEKLSRNDYSPPGSEEERRAHSLMKEIQSLNSKVPGSSSSRTQMRREIQALSMDQGMPSFFITINPADVYNPIVKLLGGKDIDIDNMLSEDVPRYWEQSKLIAKNPFVGAKFFDLYINSFIKQVLGVGAEHEGLFGKVSAYYGCVEAQGRGTLHCHMLIWLKDSLNPSEIQKIVLDASNPEFSQRLLSFLDDAITNHLPVNVFEEAEENEIDSVTYIDRFHPCSLRDPLADSDSLEAQKDIFDLVSQCQLHHHSATCYKYHKGSSPKECRFGLGDARELRPESGFDMESGELQLRVLHKQVNNFNSILLQCLRNNIDIKYVGSGPTAKAVIYYITDYITKSPLNSQIAFSAIQAALQSMESSACSGVLEFDDRQTWGKRLLQKCAFGLVSKQELSGQQVASLLMDYGESYKSHTFKSLFWTKISSQVKALLARRESEDSEGLSAADVNGSDHVNTNDRTALAGDDIVLSVEKGELVQFVEQVVDYQYRPKTLDKLCLWDLVRLTEKIPKDRRKFLDVDEGELDPEDILFALDDSTHNRPCFPFVTGHPEASKKCLRILKASSWCVPQPVGSIPRRGNVDREDNFFIAMLIMFAPWREISEIVPQSISAKDHYLKTRDSMTLYHLKTIENMQMLHECKDSRDSHFNSRHRTKDCVSLDFIEQGKESVLSEYLDTCAGEGLEEEIDCHIQNVMDNYMNSDRTIHANSCVISASTAGCFDAVESTESPFMNNESIKCIDPLDRVEKALQKSWIACYKAATDNLDLPEFQNMSQVFVNGLPGTTAFTMQPSISSMQASTRSSNDADTTEVYSPKEMPVNERTEYFCQKWSLNARQRLFFLKIISQLEYPDEKPLRVYLAGPAGTGKSRAIHAIQEYFRELGFKKRIKLTAFMGIAAKNIGGNTLHSALKLNMLTNKPTRKWQNSVQGTWEDVDFLFIDEISMVSSALLYRVSQALSYAKGITKPFGGINVIFVGDFAQLPPVAETRLYSRSERLQNINVSTPIGHAILQGRLLWLAFKTVIELTEYIRQQGTENARFIALLRRLRLGKCNESDYDLLQSRVLKHEDILHDPEWRNATMIVTNNAAKDALNEEHAKRFASETHQQLHYYYACDTFSGKPVPDSLVVPLTNLNSGLTRNKLGKIPLVLGMPVLISQNLDVEIGVVNGSTGFVRSIRYYLDSSGRRHLSCVVVEIPNTKAVQIDGLPPSHFAVPVENVDLTLRNRFNRKSLTIKRTQVPIQPAFAMTAHKAQGQTLGKIVADLATCTGSESPYVMISRVRRLDDLMILRDFDFKIISRGLSQDLRLEFRRLKEVEQKARDVLMEDLDRHHLLSKPNPPLPTPPVERPPLSDDLHRHKDPPFPLPRPSPAQLSQSSDPQTSSFPLTQLQDLPRSSYSLQDPAQSSESQSILGKHAIQHGYEDARTVRRKTF